MFLLTLFLFSFWGFCYTIDDFGNAFGSFEGSDYEDIFEWERTFGYSNSSMEIKEICKKPSPIHTGVYYKLTMSSPSIQGYVTIPPNADTDEDHSYVTLFNNSKSSQINGPRNEYYFVPTNHSGWFTLHNRYTDIYHACATVLEGKNKRRYSKMIMKYHLNSYTQEHPITSNYLWKPIPIAGRVGKFRLVSKSFPGDFITWAQKEHSTNEHYLQMEQMSDYPEYRKKYSVGGEWWEDTLFTFTTMSESSNILKKEETNYTFDKNSTTIVSSTVPFIFYVSALLLYVFKINQ